ncbi:MAG: sigma-70 family RNA polymerase sigma factor, partial [Odoribacter sp.]
LNHITAKRNQMKSSIDTVESTLVYSENVEENLEYAERMERIYRAIDSLPPKTKEILKKIYIDHHTYQEVADEMNIALNTVKSHMTMARNALRKYPGIYLFLIFLEWRQLFF